MEAVPDELLQAVELDVDTMKLYSEMEWRNLVTTKMHARERRWRQGTQAKAKLRTYRTVKSKLKMEPYLKYKNRLARHLTTRLRSGTNFQVDTRKRQSKSGLVICATWLKMKDIFSLTVNCMKTLGALFGKC